MRCKDTKLFLINNYKDHNLRFLEQVGSLTDGQRVRHTSLIKKVLRHPAAFGWQADLRIVFTDRAETEDFEDLGETRAGKRIPTFNRRRTKVAAKKLPKKGES